MSKDYFPIPDTSGMEPLTLEQYNALDGHPVIVEKNTLKKWWEIAHSLSGDTCGYGRYWWAYAYPARIDRETWGCQFCETENHCANCLYDNLPGQMEPCRSCEAHSKWKPASRFCPHCG